MKKMIRPFLGACVAWGLFFIMITGCSSCKKPDPTPPATEYTTLMLHMHTDIDTNEVAENDKGKAFRNADGRMMSLSTAQLYMSNIRGVKTDGTIVAIKDTVLLKTIENEEYTAGKIPSGNYKTIMFDIGVASAPNHKDPHGLFSTNPLSIQPTSMWFGTTANGYIFVNVAGMIDSSAAKNGQATYPFSYQIGSDALVQTVTMPEKAFQALPGGSAITHLSIDYGKLFSGIDVKTENKCATFDNTVLAAKIAHNIPSMFTYEE